MQRWIYRSAIALQVASFSWAIDGAALAQIVPDTTLPNNSIVLPNGNVLTIEGGTEAGSNLFHSFQDFSIPTGNEAFFNNSLTIDNIITRVTGGNLSDIDGLIRANGAANLFLLNPNGIVFGPNARLDIGGSFLGSTADRFLFNDGSFYSATDTAQPLLSINVPIGLQFGANPGDIQVSGGGTTRQPFPNGATPEELRAQETEFQRGLLGLNDPTQPFVPEQFMGLAVEPGQTLSLVGGDVNLSGGLLAAPQGRIELGSTGENGRVDLTPDNAGFTLDYPELNIFRDIRLSEKAGIFTSGEGGGNIQVQGHNLSVINGSEITTANLGAEPPGTIAIRTTETVDVSGVSGDTSMNVDANMDTDSVSSRVGVIALGSRNTMTEAPIVDAITIDTQQLSVRDEGIVAAASLARRNVGNVNIQTSQLSIQDGGQVSTNARSEGDAGDVKVRATSSVEISGIAPDSNQPSRLGAVTLDTENPRIAASAGNSGDVIIETRRLSVRDGANVVVGTSNSGDSGQIEIDADELVEITGDASGLFAVTVDDGSTGSIDIETKQFSVNQGGEVSTTTTSSGNAGNINIDATESVVITGFESSLQAETRRGTGNAGDINIGHPETGTGQFVLSNGGRVSASTDDSGGVGRITINARESVNIIGPDSRLEATNENGAISDPNGISIQIDTGEFTIRDGGVVSSLTEGSGPAGDININATESVVITGVTIDPDADVDDRLRASSVLAETTSTEADAGDAGDINIGNIETGTGRFILSNGGRVSASTDGLGGVGSITVNAPESVSIIGPDSSLEATNVNDPRIGPRQPSVQINTEQFTVRDGGLISSLTEGSGPAGTIEIDVNQLSLENGGLILAGTTGSGSAGTIDINARESVAVAGSGLFAVTSNTGDAGSLLINTGRLVVSEGSLFFVVTANSGRAGTIDINASESVEILGGSLLLAGTTNQEEGAGKAGSITIDTEELTVRGGAAIVTGTSGRGDGGNIEINATESVDIIGPDTVLGANTTYEEPGAEVAGKAGNVTINTEEFTARNGGAIVTFTSGDGMAGNINIRASQSVAIEDIGSGLLAGTRARGEAGDITIGTDDLLVRDGAFVGVASLPEEGETEPGNPGEIDITAENVRIRDTSGVIAISETGEGGNINVTAEDVRVQGLSDVSAYGQETQDGNIYITSNVLVLFQDGSRVITRAEDPRGGSNVTVQAQPDSGLAFFLCNTCRIGADGTLLIFDEIEDPTVIVSDPLSVDDLIREDICVTGLGSEFYVTGRGGIPPSPLDILPSQALVTLDWVVESPEETADNGNNTEVAKFPIPEVQPPLIEAQGWQVGENGEIILTAEAHAGTSYSEPDTGVFRPIRCEDLWEEANANGID